MIGSLPAALDDGSPVQDSERVVEVQNLSVSFVSDLRRLRVLSDVSYDVGKAETLCLLGESGSGKSVSLRTLIRLLPPQAEISGSIRVAGSDVCTLDRRELRRLRGAIASMVFQEPATAFDPTFTIGDQIVEAIIAHEDVSKVQARQRALDLLELVQIPSAARRLAAYPFELSGGLRQRAMIALALSCRPKLLLADEPTTALDATVQIQVLTLLRRLQRELGMAIIFVTHDVGVACEIADRVAVMYAGRIVETGRVDQVMLAPAHPYTRGLLASIVPLEGRERLRTIPGAPPELAFLPPGCSFEPRCGEAIPACRERMPDAILLDEGRQARCFLAAERLR